MVWHKPFLTTYSDNYRYGSSLYTGSVGDIEKKYRDTLASTKLRSDRGDLGLYTFAGSHLHGGTPAADSGSMPSTSGGSSRATTNNLYEPLSFGYGRNYYNNLRADYQKPKPKETKTSSSSYGLVDESLSTSADVSTHKAKTTTSYDDAKKTVTTTTTTERWVPLTSYLYGNYTPTYYYYSSTPFTSTVRTYKTKDDLYYSDQLKSSASKNIDALDLNVSSYSMHNFDYNNWMEKCRDIQGQLDQVNQWVAEAEAKIKTDVVGARNKMQTELTEVTLLVEDTTKYNEELQRVIKRQARQITDLHSQYDDINRHLVDVTDNLEKSRVRCQSLSGDLASVQTGLEMALRRK